MDRSTSSLDRVARVLGYLLVGVLGSAGTALVVLTAARPVQGVVYDLFYLRVGPSEATETAVLTHFVGAAVVAAGGQLFLGDLLSDRLANRAAVARGAAALAGVLVAFLAVALAGLAAVPTAFVVVAAGVVGVPLLVRYRYGVRSGAVPASVGAVPVVVLLLLLAGFGLGWGGGYVLTAREVPASAVNGTVADFSEAPEVGADLFAAGSCETDAEGRRVCRLHLRGYDREVAAARFAARHGVRCPYRNDRRSDRSGTFVARYDGTYYRVSCGSFGD